MPDNIDQLIAPEQYQATRSAVFHSMPSLSWFIRQHREQLLAAGALLSPTGRKMIHAGRFDQVVLEVGQRRAEADAAKDFHKASA
jgi:hypothetical protein